MTTRTPPPSSSRLSRPGAWKNDVEKVRRPCRMSCRGAPEAQAAAAPAGGFATFIPARARARAGRRGGGPPLPPRPPPEGGGDGGGEQARPRPGAELEHDELALV